MATEYQIARASQRDTKPQTDLHNDANTLLQRYPISPEDLALALGRLQRQAPDLIHMLGLGGPAAGEPLAPIDVDCPDCTGTVSNRCVNSAGRDVEKFHIGRVRLAANAATVQPGGTA